MTTEITEIDLELARGFMPDVAAKKDAISLNKIKATAKTIATAMQPEREELARLRGNLEAGIVEPAAPNALPALQALVGVLKRMEAHPDFKAVWKHASQAGLPYQGPTWKKELAAATAVLDQLPTPSPAGD